MTIALRAAGAWAAGSTSVAPAIPTGTTTGDIMLLYVGCKPFSATINTPSGWNPLSAGSGTNGSVANGVDVGSVRWAVFYREWQSGDAAPSVSITSGNVALGVIKSFSKAAGNTWATPVAAKGSDTSSGTGFSLAMDADPGITVDDMLAHFATIAGNNATFGTPTITATGATIGTVTESPTTEGATATGNDLESSASHALCTAGTASAAPTCGWTLSAAQTGGGCIIRLREAAGAVSISAAGNIASAFAAGTQSAQARIDASGLAGAEAFGTATVSILGDLSSVGNIASAFAASTPAASVAVAPGGVASSEAVGAPSASANVSATGLAGAEAFGSPTLSDPNAPYSITNAGGFYDNADFGSASVSVQSAAGGGRRRPRFQWQEPTPRPLYLLDVNVKAAGAIESAEAFGVPGLNWLRDAEIRKHEEKEFFQIRR